MFFGCLLAVSLLVKAADSADVIVEGSIAISFGTWGFSGAARPVCLERSKGFRGISW